MPFNTNILKSHTARQAVGAVVGMLAAGFIYVTFDQISSSSLSGLLIDSTSNISLNAGQVSINDKEADDADVRSIAGRARAVADALKQSAETSYEEPAAPQTPVNERAASRREKRIFANQLTAENEMTPVYPVAKFPEDTEQRDRIDARNAQVAALRAEAAHPGAPAGSLPNSGLGLNLLIVTAAAIAFAAMKKDVRDRLRGVFADIV